MFTILGAGGAIGNELVKELTPRNEAIRLVSRNPTMFICTGRWVVR
jgi:putative NADH-flavin reductase